jgi:hypothetical protein
VFEVCGEYTEPTKTITENDINQILWGRSTLMKTKFSLVLKMNKHK